MSIMAAMAMTIMTVMTVVPDERIVDYVDESPVGS